MSAEVNPLETARIEAGMSEDDLWLAYFALGGTVGPEQIHGVLCGEVPTSPHQQDIVAHAINERFAERGLNHPLTYLEP